MFSRRKKNDGFDWHKYVRTTIKLRREGRKKLFKDIRLSAAAGAKSAGQAGVSAGRYGALRVVSAVGALLFYIRSVINWGVNGFALLFHALVGRKFLSVLICSLKPLWQSPELAALFNLIGLLIAGFLAVRLSAAGYDMPAVVAAYLVFLFLLLSMLPVLLKLPYILQRLAAAKIFKIARFSKIGSRIAIGVASVSLVSAAAAAIWYAILNLPLSPVFTAKSTFSWLTNFMQVENKSVEGVAKAMTGDTMEINGTPIELAGVEAPELLQICRDLRGRRWQCGRAAYRSLARLTGYKPVRCDYAERPDTSIKIGVCLVDGKDIAEVLAKAGWVFTAASSDARYKIAEETAQKLKFGVWNGQAERPATYRQAALERAKKQAPNGCPIKGHISKANGKIYLMPWSPGYRLEHIDEQHGERWFCTSSQAMAAGWRPDPRM